MKLSREGIRFFLATILIAVAALNTGNNLIYLILSMMLSILALSVLILKINTYGLAVEVSPQYPVFANTPANVDVTLTNKKKMIPSYSINVLIPGHMNKEAYFQKVPAKADMLTTVSVTFRKRGVYAYGDFFMESSFPFIFFTQRIKRKTGGEIIVYPELKKIDRSDFESPGKGSEFSLSRIGKGDEFATVREFRYGDDWRRIHWKASAKTSKIMIMEYSVEEAKRLTVILDNLAPYDSGSFEKAVSFAASICESFLADGFFLRLLTCRKVFPFGAGRDHLFKILDFLAAVQRQDSWECPPAPEHEGLTVLILNSEHSPLKRFIPESDTVIYATAL